MNILYWILWIIIINWSFLFLDFKPVDQYIWQTIFGSWYTIEQTNTWITITDTTWNWFILNEENKNKIEKYFEDLTNTIENIECWINIDTWIMTDTIECNKTKF